ncbi:MAG TPA: aspartate--tRNA ligase [Fimbriimonadaceae bacterium]|nr:aspartate--tRNA ligase [Fimbriimonadaceae bacterium]HRJ95331.1 aspartate--tRNA ligase [Fimbriimonadaceae bacterium]
MSFAQRTHGCGEPRASHAGEQVILNGWAHRVRDLGGVCFVDLRDRSGIVQLVFDPSRFQNLAEIRSESCLSVTGTVRLRDPDTKNPAMPTGEVEIVVTGYNVLGPAKTLPFPVSDEEQMTSVNEELRIKYRYLDLRRPAMYRKFAIRAAAIRRIRAYLDQREFLEIETPIFTKSTPEGARDYLVPYRLEPGLFYALPQSPQQYKQLLMVAGVERYYQIAKCFRDEAQRADRQPEFTQLDLEMSFVTQEDVLRLIEGLTVEVVNGLIEEFDLPKDRVEGFARLTYDESMHLYGCDKPDLRFGLQLFDISSVVKDCGFGVFKSCIDGGGFVRGIRYPGGASLSRKEIGILEEFCKEFGAKGMASFGLAQDPADAGEGAVVLADGRAVKGSIAKFFKPEELVQILETAKAEPGDLLCFIADAYSAGNNVLFRLRNEIGERCGLRDQRKVAFCFVLDFPLVEWNPESSRWDATHHPFTAPKAEDLIYIDTDPGRIRADCYDVVCNGTEWASGSIRIHRPDIQERCFKLLGLDEETIRARFGHMIEAFEYGAPPHGGIAPGIDRLIMFLTDDENIREVIAFPKIGQGMDPMMGAPSTIDPQQWAELGLRLGE